MITGSSTAEQQNVALSADLVCALRVARSEGCQGVLSNI